MEVKSKRNMIGYYNRDCLFTTVRDIFSAAEYAPQTLDTNIQETSLIVHEDTHQRL